MQEPGHRGTLRAVIGAWAAVVVGTGLGLWLVREPLGGVWGGIGGALAGLAATSRLLRPISWVLLSVVVGILWLGIFLGKNRLLE